MLTWLLRLITALLLSVPSAPAASLRATALPLPTLAPAVPTPTAPPAYPAPYPAPLAARTDPPIGVSAQWTVYLAVSRR
jgi:hypothetical protein